MATAHEPRPRGAGPGKSPGPQGGTPGSHGTILTGADAADALAEGRRQTISRRQLDRHAGFAQVSPQLGQLDEAAFDQLVAETPEAALDLVAKMTRATDAGLAHLARRLAGRLVLDLARTGRARAPGVGKLDVARADQDPGDLDLDRSIDELVAARAARRPPALDELRTTRWRKPGTAICLLVDQSGSMDGRRLASAALAAAVCAWRAPDRFAVLAFSDQVVAIKQLDEPKPAGQVVNEVLALRGHGTTDVALALRAAATELAPVPSGRRLTVLLSDAEATTGDDPVPAARALDELAVLAPADEPGPAQALVRAGGARMAEVDGPFSVLDALRLLVR